jgi:hypothetical protein
MVGSRSLPSSPVACRCPAQAVMVQIGSTAVMSIAIRTPPADTKAEVELLGGTLPGLTQAFKPISSRPKSRTAAIMAANRTAMMRFIDLETQASL